MANNNKLKAYVRYDGTGRVLPGGPILQRFKPKVGNWVEIDANQCCNFDPTIITDTIPGAFPLSYVAIRMFCDGVSVRSEYGPSTEVNNMTELIELLNSDENTSSFGTYTAIDSTTVQLSVPLSVKNDICPNGVLTFNIFED